MIRKGDRVFFADNSKGYLERCKAFTSAVRDAGLVPLSYGGAGTAVRQSTLDREIRDDFYGAQAIVLYFGTPENNSNYEDHWALSELKHRIGTNVDFLVYVSEDFPVGILQQFGYVGQHRVLSNSDQFGAVLRSDLERIIEHSP